MQRTCLLIALLVVGCGPTITKPTPDVCCHKPAIAEVRAGLLGKTQAEVKRLLGPPDSTRERAWWYSGRDHRIVWNPDSERWVGLDVYFDEDGKVIDAQ